MKRYEFKTICGDYKETDGYRTPLGGIRYAVTDEQLNEEGRQGWFPVRWRDGDHEVLLQREVPND